MSNAMSNAMSETFQPTISWDFGTAYEFLISLHVIHQPDHYGIRASWAAGIRSRIPAAERKFLEEVVPFLGLPLCPVQQLPEPKDALTLLWSIRQTPAVQRVSKLLCLDEWKEPMAQVFLNIAEKGTWEESDFNLLAEKYAHNKEKKITEEQLKRFLEWWAKPQEFGEMLFTAFQAYQQAFFDEEEKRVAPVLKDGLKQAQELAKTLSVLDLLTELSQGVHLEIGDQIKEIVIVPAYWTTPLVMFADLSEDKMLFVYGARPANMSAVPGEKVPDGLIRTLKAIADPTRLKILHDLSHEELTPSELARRLHLRAPTVTHHLNELRLAGLVNLSIEGQEKRYTARREALKSAFENLEDFLDSE